MFCFVPWLKCREKGFPGRFLRILLGTPSVYPQIAHFGTNNATSIRFIYYLRTPMGLSHNHRFIMPAFCVLPSPAKEKGFLRICVR